jgi:hypothetical protein
MVVRTRSSGTSAAVVSVAAPVAPARVVAPVVARAPRRAARFATPSYTDASLRSYKIYTPKRRPVRGVVAEESEPELGFENDAVEAAEALASMNYASEASEAYEAYEASEAPIPAAAAASFHHPRSCLNPMRPVTRYIYKLNVYNLSQTSHYNTSYVMYNRDTRTYHVYSVISTTGAAASGATAAMATGESLPEPTNTIQTRYTTYMSADSYIMSVVIPCDQREYCVLADFVGVIMDDNEFKQRAFGEDSCYYDIDELWNSHDSKETLTGHKMFVLTPTRVYYWDAGAGSVPTAAMYTVDVINSALNIIASVHQ